MPKMITLEGEITELACPPNKADMWRSITIWFPDSEEHVEFTFSLDDIKQAGLKEGDKLTIRFDKKHDIDPLPQDLLNID